MRARSAVRLRHQYLIAGVAWALLLGSCAALSLFAFAAGVSWLWLFGDDPWPAATQWVLPLIGLVAGVGIAGLCVVLATSYGTKREALGEVHRRGERSRLLVLTAVPLVIIAGLGAKAWTEAEEYSRAMTAATQREADFASLVATRHRIDGVTVEHNDGAFHAGVRLFGGREGEYRLAWRVVDTGFGTAVTGGERVVRLQPGSRQVELAYRLDDLARGYRDRLLDGGGVLVEEPFHLEVTIEPLLDPAEHAALPPGERRRLKMGESPLHSRASASFPVCFIVRSDGSIAR